MRIAITYTGCAVAVCQSETPKEKDLSFFGGNHTRDRVASFSMADAFYRRLLWLTFCLRQKKITLSVLWVHIDTKFQSW